MRITEPETYCSMGVTNETGYAHCACRDCFDIVCGPGLCPDCEESDCEGETECRRDDAYGCDPTLEGTE